MDFYNSLQDTACTLGFGQDGQRKCSLEDSAKFCTDNPQQLCCTASNNTIPALVGGTEPPTNTTNTEKPDNNASSEKTSSVVNPLFIGLAAMGVILVVIIASAVYFFKRPKKTNVGPIKQSKNNNTSRHDSFASSAVNNSQMEAIFDYQANLFDELTLSTIN